jgi:hypothetical protein
MKIKIKPKSIFYYFTTQPITLQITKQSYHVQIRTFHYELSIKDKSVLILPSTLHLNKKDAVQLYQKYLPYFQDLRLSHINIFLFGA